MYIKILVLVAKIFLLSIIMVCLLYRLAAVAKKEGQKEQAILKARIK
jgi:hypothetical protein